MPGGLFSSSRLVLRGSVAALRCHLSRAGGSGVPVFLQLKEQLSQAEQIHKSELEGMRREVCRLTQELHQRDVAIASASGSTSDLEQRLRAEIERAERKAVEHRVREAESSAAPLEGLSELGMPSWV